MRRVADAQQARPPPLFEAIDSDAQELDVVPAFQFADPVGEEGRHVENPPAERFKPLRLDLFDAALLDDIGALPVIAAVEHDHHPAGLDMAEGVRRVVGLARDAKPQHVHRRAVILARETCLFAHRGMPAVTADDEIGADDQHAVRRLGAQPDDPAALLDQIGRLRLSCADRRSCSVCRARQGN